MNRLTDALKKEKLTFGTERTLKLLKNGKVKVVFLASNVKKEVKEEIEQLSKLKKIEIVELNVPNTELGVICKKSFPLSVLCY